MARYVSRHLFPHKLVNLAPTHPLSGGNGVDSRVIVPAMDNLDPCSTHKVQPGWLLVIEAGVGLTVLTEGLGRWPDFIDCDDQLVEEE